jgi:hypothetical protein
MLLADRGAFPWLTASRLPELLLYEPIGRQDTTGEPLPTHIRTPDGKEYSLTDEALLKEIATRHRADVELMQLSHGIFDEAGVSAITLGTIRSIGRDAGHDPDIRRFRPNLVIDTKAAQPFEEDRWVGKINKLGVSSAGDERQAGQTSDHGLQKQNDYTETRHRLTPDLRQTPIRRSRSNRVKAFRKHPGEPSGRRWRSWLP